MDNKEQYMQMAIDLAEKNLDGYHGGPFGAVVVRDGVVVGKGSNEVVKGNDPTAHAEVVAIREAANKLGTFDLSGCEIYTSCEPCPMCLGAIYWSRIDTLYYAASREHAASAGFDDAFFYQEMALPVDERRSLKSIRMMDKVAIETFNKWIQSGQMDKVKY